MELSPNEIETGLQRKGWEKKERTNHSFFYFKYEGKITNIRTFLSRGKKSYGNTLINAIKKQIYLDNNKQVVEYIKCKLSNGEYIKILKSKGKY